MNADQIIITIYNYLFNELSRKEEEVKNKSKYLDSFSESAEYLYRYWNAKKDYEAFNDFALKIFEILRYYEE